MGVVVLQSATGLHPSYNFRASVDLPTGLGMTSYVRITINRSEISIGPVGIIFLCLSRALFNYE